MRYGSRVLTIVVTLLCAVLAATVFVGGGTQQRFWLDAANAGQLVKGDLVKVGGVRAGIVESISLGSDNQAEIAIRVDDASVLPLHEGTLAEIRLSSLSSVAGRYVGLLPGPNNRPELKSGATIRATDVSVPVEIDQLLSVFDAETRRAFRSALRGSATIYHGQTAAANRAVRAFNPALTEMATTAREVGRDDALLERFLVQSASVFDVLAQRNPAIDAAIRDTADTAASLASRRRDLEMALRRAPRAFGRAQATLARLTTVGRDLQGALDDARPVAPRLAVLLRTLDRVVPRARPALESVQALAPLATATLRTIPALNRTGTPAVRDVAKALADAAPIVAGARPYLPDVIHGFLSGFGGQTFTYYDANGHYGRVRPIIYAGSTQTNGLLSSLLQTSVAGDAEQRNIFRRCPGGATDPAPDRSNPYQPAEVTCDPAEVP